MTDILKAVDTATALSQKTEYQNRMQQWGTIVAEADPENTLNLHGGKLAALSIAIGTQTPEDTAQNVLEHTIQILKADRNTNFDDLLKTVSEARKKS